MERTGTFDERDDESRREQRAPTEGARAERVMHGQPGHEHMEGDEAHYTGDHNCVGENCSHDHRFHQS